MLIPNLRAQVACLLCRIGGFAHLWNRGSETPLDEFTHAMALRRRPRILVLAQRLWQGKGEIEIEELVTGLTDTELAAVCELLQASKAGPSGIEAWLRRWSALPAPDRLRKVEEEPEAGAFRLEPDSPTAHRRSRS